MIATRPHELRHSDRPGAALFQQSLHNTCPVARVLVLTDLPLALQRQNLDLDPHDAFQLPRQIVLGRIRNRPGCLAVFLIAPGQIVQKRRQPLRVAVKPQNSVSMNDRIVLGRNDLPVVLL